MKKPGLGAATPNNVEANALLDDAAHDFLTARLSDPDLTNATLVVGVLRTVEAGGHDVNGDRTTKLRIDHLEVAFEQKDEDDLVKTLKRMAKNRTGKTSVDALNPAEDTPIPGMADAIADAETPDGTAGGDDVE